MLTSNRLTSQLLSLEIELFEAVIQGEALNEIWALHKEITNLRLLLAALQESNARHGELIDDSNEPDVHSLTNHQSSSSIECSNIVGLKLR